MQYPTIAQPQYGFAPTMPMMPSMSDMPPAMMAKGGLASIAQSVQSKGRGKDTMLVHMTPKEVGGLQALAMQHGGSLTINPQTGLPEAGFLENLLPTLLGAALTIGSGGVINPYMSAAIVGGIQTVRTGDLGQGLLAGLGAFGGAGMGAGLTAAGASTAVPGAVAAPGATASALTPAEIAAATGTDVAATAPSSLGTTVNPATLGDTGAAIYGGAPSPAMEAANLAVDPMAVPGNSARVLAPPSATPPTPTIGENFAQAGRGVESIFEPGGFDKFIGDPAVTADPSKGIQAAPATGLGGGYGAAKTVGMAAAPALLATPKYDVPDQEKEEPYEGPYTPTKRAVSYPGDDERRRTSEFTYFTPSNPVPFAEGGETAGLSASSMTAPEAEVFSQIANVQRLAGLPAIDTSGFNILPSVDRAALVYNPIGNSYMSPTSGSGGLAGAGERSYGFQSLSSDIEPGGMPSKAIVPQTGSFYKPVKNAKNIKNINLQTDSDEYREQYEQYVPTSNINMSLFEYDPLLGGYKQRVIEDPYQSAKGGSVPQLESGGFVLTKKAVDGLGRGSNEKGQANAQRGLGAIPIRGPGTGTSDSIKTSIDKKRPALVSNGEAYVPKKQVAKKGGAKAFYALMKQAEKSADKRSRA